MILGEEKNMVVDKTAKNVSWVASLCGFSYKIKQVRNPEIKRKVISRFNVVLTLFYLSINHTNTRKLRVLTPFVYC